MAETLNVRALCSLDDLKGFLPGFTVGVADDADDVLTRLINAATTLIYRHTNREFVARDAVLDANGAVTLPAGKATIAAATRVFDVTADMLDWWDDDTYRRLEIGDLSADPTEIVTKDAAGAVVETLTAGQWQTRPRLRDADEPVTALWFPPQVDSPALLAVGYTVEVTGVFGYPEIPEPVRQATIETATAPYAKDLEKFSATFNIDSRHVVLPRAIPDRARSALKPYRSGLAA